MITSHLKGTVFDVEHDMVATRDGFGRGVVRAAERDERVVVLCADLAESTRAHWFKEKFPDRFIEVGVAEQNLAAVASGLANYGKIPFITSYAAFSPGRSYEQVRTTVALNNVPVKIMGMHAGISVGPDGATHQMLEDMGLMRMLPNMTVINPCDAVEAEKAVVAVAASGKPAYIRFGREKTAVMTTEQTSFEVGKAYAAWESPEPQVAIIASGPLLHHALVAAKFLEEKGVGTLVINNHTIKPLDEETIVAAARKTGAVVTVEEHQIAGGMGSAIAELLVEKYFVPMRFVGVRDRFGQSGEMNQLITEYGLDANAIAKAVREVIGMK